MSGPSGLPDKHELYEQAAQSPRRQAQFLRALHARGHSDAPLILGEDFAGTGALSRQWVTLAPGATAVCVDHNPEVLARGKGVAGVTTHCADVSEIDDPADVICALNFSICEIHDRARLVAYLSHVRPRLRESGVFVADLYGGADAFVEGESDVELREGENEQDGPGVRYVWEQRLANPMTGRVVNAMHFVLESGETMPDAFVYDWRLWSVPELRDAMIEAGFASTEVYDRLGDAVDEDGHVYAEPLGGDDTLDDNFVVYVAARETA